MLTKKDKQWITEFFQEGLRIALSPIIQKLDTMERRLRAMNKKLDVTISYFDRDTSKHNLRIKRVENHLNLPPLAD